MNPFSGDEWIKQEFLNIRNQYNISTVIETGTYKGDTTAWLAENFKNVITIEVKEEYYNLGSWLQKYKNLIRLNTPSQNVLCDLLSLLKEPTLLFLDAHWEEECATPKELEVIARSFNKPFIVIHDVENPRYPEMQFDTYPNFKYNINSMIKYFDNIYGPHNWTHYHNEKSTANIGCLFVYGNTI